VSRYSAGTVSGCARRPWAAAGAWRRGGCDAQLKVQVERHQPLQAQRGGLHRQLARRELRHLQRPRAAPAGNAPRTTPRSRPAAVPGSALTWHADSTRRETQSYAELRPDRAGRSAQKAGPSHNPGCSRSSCLKSSPMPTPTFCTCADRTGAAVTTRITSGQAARRTSGFSSSARRRDGSLNSGGGPEPPPACFLRADACQPRSVSRRAPTLVTETETDTSAAAAAAASNKQPTPVHA
jgi:hypothetical protein